MAATLLQSLEIYGALGLAAAAIFLLIGVDRIDPSARGSYLFRVLLIPGIVVLWPAVLWRWAQLERGRGEK